MRKKLKLEDTYRFPGFRPAAMVHGVFGDQKARVVALKRTGTRMVCGGCGAVNHAVYDSKVRKVRDRKCGKVRQEKLDWLSDNPGYTKRFAFFYRAEMPGEYDNGGSRGDEAGLEDR